MNARDIIKLAAQLYVYEESKKNITVLTNIQKGKDINIDVFVEMLCEDCLTEILDEKITAIKPKKIE